MNFGLPSKRIRKTERFDFPVLTILPEPTVKGGSRKFALNAAARTLLNINKDEECTVSIGVPEANNGNFIIANTTNNSDVRKDYRYDVHTTDWTFSNRKMYYYIANAFNLNTNQENYFSLMNNNGVIVLTPYNPNSVSDQDMIQPAVAVAHSEQEQDLKLS